MREQLNNQSSQLSKSQLFQAAFLSKIKMRNINDVQSITAELGPIASYLNDVQSIIAELGPIASYLNDVYNLPLYLGTIKPDQLLQ